MSMYVYVLIFPLENFYLTNSSFFITLTLFLQGGGYQPPGSGRARRDAAARAMQGWHSQRLLGYGEVAEPIIKVC